MINTLDEYICCSIPADKPFTTNPNLLKKVDQNGSFLEFIGNTVVFLLDDNTKIQLSYLQEELYDAAGDLLSARLIPDTFHMTLHDLVNGSAEDCEISQRMKLIRPSIQDLLQDWKNDPPIRMKTTWMFNMVNTSIVLGLRPADVDSYNRLNEMYERLEEELRLGYAMTPHITLAYFKPGVYGCEVISKLAAALRPVAMDVLLRIDQLVLQNFTDMNHYYTVF